MMPELMPDLPGYVHGIKSTNPWTVQCDGCGSVRTGKKASEAILCADRIVFNAKAEMSGMRMCYACWEKQGWPIRD